MFAFLGPVGLILKIGLSFLTGGGVQGIVQQVTGYLGKLNDNQTAQFQTAVGATRDVKIAELQAGAQAWHDRVDLLKGLKVSALLIVAASLPPLWHQALVFFDSCPYLPWPSLSPFHLVTPHVQGSWRVAALPGAYGDHEWAVIASLLGIQTTAATVMGVVRYLKK